MKPTINSILTVDDDAILQQVLKAYFERHGVRRILQAGDGAEAKRLLKEHPEIELVICDLHMPDVDGVEFIDHLNESGSRAQVLILSSANSTTVAGATALAKAYGLSFIGALPKPVNFEDLRRMLGWPRPGDT
ncbi:MAG: response regulator [Alphaproteobacteria bacterium]|nr:response regulator [Alphaproteobacteria bacterium]